MTAPTREQCPLAARGELCACYNYGKGNDYCPYAAPGGLDFGQLLAAEKMRADEPTATDADRLVHDLRAIAIDFAGDHQVDNTCRAAADLIERQAREIDRWNELHRVIAQELDCDPETWPDHRNAPLAIGATFVLIKQRAERAEAERDALREQCQSANDACRAAISETEKVIGENHALRECVKAADEVRARFRVIGILPDDEAAISQFDAARAKVKP